MKKKFLVFISILLFVLIGHAKSGVIETIRCINENNNYDTFEVFNYEGNQKTKLFEQDGPMSKQTYFLTHKELINDQVTEIYTVYYSNVSPTPASFQLQYRLSDYQQNPQRFNLKSNMRQDKKYICKVD